MTSVDQASISFNSADCGIFAKYPKSVNYNEVALADKQHFKDVWLRLKAVAADASGRWSHVVPMKPHTSQISPNGRNSPDMWCCIYPQSVRNKSYSLQIATIISSAGCEFCFCLGSGTAQIKSPDEIRENGIEFERLRTKLRNVPPNLVETLNTKLLGQWQYRRQWRQVPGSSDFDSFEDWLRYASSEHGNGASISRNLSPVELEQLGTAFGDQFNECVDIFEPLFQFAYGELNNLEGENNSLRLFISAIKNLRVDRPEGSPRMYKPALLLSIISAIEDGTLSENIIPFDFVLPRFLDVMRRFGLEGGEKQASSAFFHMTNEPFWGLQLRDPSAPPKAGEPAQIRKFVDHAYFAQTYWNVLKDNKLRKQIEECVLQHWFSISTGDQMDEVIADFNYAESVENLIADIENRGYTFEPWQIACYIAALRTKPFLILAGVSGTGKSQLPRLIAEQTGGLCELITVRPDWTDSSEVLGYVELKGGLRPGPLLQLAKRAMAARKSYHVCIVDEMNLARVEHYFAEVLSRIEELRADGEFSGSLLNHILSDEDQGWLEVKLPTNLALVGTVNMDESTHGFSKKVLDRAFTLEFSEIDLAAWQTHPKKTLASRKWPIYAWTPRATCLSGLQEISNEERAFLKSIVDVLIGINKIIAQGQLQLGYRSRDEICLFVLHASEIQSTFRTSNGELVDPLDLALQMKVLPRIAGGSGAIRRMVLELLGWSLNGSVFHEEDDALKSLVSWQKDGRPFSFAGAHYPRTASRLCLMWERILNEGYTSYWL